MKANTPISAPLKFTEHSPAAIVGAILAWRFGLDTGPTRPVAVFEIARRIGVSPDGRFVAFEAEPVLPGNADRLPSVWLADLERGETRLRNEFA